MANRLKMAEHQAIIGLARLRWSYRRIAAELGMDRETVSRHVKAALGDPPGLGPPLRLGSGQADPNAAISIAGSAAPEAEANATISIAGSAGSPQVGRRSRCEPWRAVIVAALERGLTAQRIWQDLKAEHGYTDSYQTVQRFVRKLHASTPLPFRRMECEPGEEAQVDFGRGAPILTPDGKSHIAQALGYQAIKNGFVVLYRSIFDLVRDFLHEDAMAQQDKLMERYLRADLLIVDDMGMKQLPARSGEYLFEIIMRRYQVRSTMMTSNRPLEDWGKLIGDVPAATAILDRFLHNAQVIAITGKSYRLRNRAAAEETQSKQKGRRSTADGEGFSPLEDTATVQAVSSGAGAQPASTT